MGNSGQACWVMAHDARFGPKETVGEGRDESGGFYCDSGAADSGSAFTALLRNVKVITGP